jgi:PAS domain S-box-containing protein
MKTRGSAEKQTSQIENGSREDTKPVFDPVRVEELSQEHFSYLRLLFFLVISVFLAEVVAMIVVYELPPLRYGYVTLIDAGIMTILIFPLLYFLSFRPLVRHIEKRKHAEEANRRLSSIIEQTEDTVVVTNREGVIEYVNPAFERLTGYTKEEVLGKTPRVIKSGLHNEQFYREMWETILRGQVFQREIANRKKNGELFYEVKTITPLRDAQGNITHFVATGKDITQHILDEEKLLRAYDELELRVSERTEELRLANSALGKEISERKQAEELVRQREAMFRAVLEQMPSGVTVRDSRTGQLTFSNVRSLEILDALVEVPEQFSEYHGFHPDGRAYPKEDWPLYRSMSTGEVIRAEEIECERKDGTRFIMSVNSAPVYDAEGTIVNGVSVFDDITERKRAQAALQAANEELRRFNQAMIGRELRMIELKKEVNELCEQGGQPSRYSLDFERDEHPWKM